MPKIATTVRLWLNRRVLIFMTSHMRERCLTVLHCPTCYMPESTLCSSQDAA